MLNRATVDLFVKTLWTKDGLELMLLEAEMLGRCKFMFMKITFFLNIVFLYFTIVIKLINYSNV